MKSTLHPQFPQNIFHHQSHLVTFPRSRSDVRQDKSAFAVHRPASGQPASQEKVMLSQQVSNNPPRSPEKPSRQQKAVVITLWVKPELKTELKRIAEQDGVSISAAGGAFLHKALQQNADMQYGALLGPIIEKAIDRRMRARDNRLVALLVRIAFETGQIRGIVTNNLAIQPGITNENIQTVLTESEKEAKANITRLTPQIAEIINELKNWQSDEEAEYTA
jgi:hypothetical protein